MDQNTIIDYLWQDGTQPSNPQVFALLDGARDKKIAPMVARFGHNYECLYAGKLSAQLQAAAPYIVHLASTARFTQELIQQGWGNSWGIFCIAPPHVDLEAQRRHFRTLLRVRDESGRRLIFRFYDPRVLRIYLPTCNNDQAKMVFGPNAHFLAESDDASGFIRYRRDDAGVSGQATPPLRS